MRSRNYLVKTQQRMVCRRRFLDENVNRCSGDGTVLYCVVKRVLIYQTTAGTVDDTRSLLHFSQDVAINHSASFVGQGCMHRQEIGAGITFRQRHQFNLEVTRLVHRNERIVGNNDHAQATGARSNHASNTTQSDDAKRFALEFDSDKFLALP